MLTSQPLTLEAIKAHRETIIKEVAAMPVDAARAWYAREFRYGALKCHLSRKAIVEALRAFCDRALVTDAQCQF